MRISVVALLLFLLSANVSARGETLIELPSMEQGRYNHTSAIFQGELMVIGGTSHGTDSLSSVELLHDGVWMGLDPMSESRMRHASVSLPDGRVLVSGGYQGGEDSHPSLFKHYANRSRSLRSCELYDGSWSEAPPMRTGRFWHSMVVLDSGDVMVIGGLNSTTGALSSCEIYSGGEWREASSISSPRARFSTTVLNDGRVLITGGHDGLGKRSVDICEIYDPEEDRWELASPLLESRGYHDAVLLQDGRVMVSGGFATPTEPDRRSSEIYDPGTDSWTFAGNMSFPRHNHKLVLLGDTVLSIGGSNCETGGSHSNVEAYNDGWFDTGMVMSGRIWLGADNVDGKVISHGGKACQSAFRGAEEFSEPRVKESSFFWAMALIAVPVAIGRRILVKDRP